MREHTLSKISESIIQIAITLSRTVLPGNLCLAFPHAAKAPVHDGCDPLRLWRHPAIFLFDSFHAAVVVFFV